MLFDIKQVRALILLICFGILLAACGNDNDPTPEATEPPPTPTPEPAARLAQAGEAMAALESAGFSITRTGGTIYLDADQTLVLSTATGYYSAPESLRATIKVLGPGLALEMAAIQIGEERWLTNPLSERWEAVPPEWGLDLLALFSEETGWRTILADHTSNVVQIGETTFGEATRLQYRADIDGEQAGALTAGITGNQDLTVDFWLDPATNRIVQLQFETPSADPEPAQWRLVFDALDEPVIIEPPPVAE
jgi:hypothetical protein